MKHFWLGDDQQALMDAATSTASNYGHVALIDVPLAWKTRVKKMAGSTVAEADHFRLHNITRISDFRLGTTWVKLRSVIRLTANQAMMLKLRIGGSGDGIVLPDPTGETWGNITIADADRPLFELGQDRHHRYSATSAEIAFHDLIEGRPFGPTLATIGDTCKGMPSNWARAFVWKNRHHTNLFKMPAELPDVEYLKRGLEVTPLENVILCRDVFDNPVETQGQVGARLFTLKMQHSSERRKLGLGDALDQLL